MSGQHTDRMTENIADQWVALGKFWTELGARMANTFAQEPVAPPPESARRIRDAIFGVMAETLDTYLRSPEFLESMRQAMDLSLTMRKQMSDVLTAARHESQGTAKDDVDALLRSVQHLEKRILDRLEDLEERIERIDKESASARPKRPRKESASAE